MIRSPRTGIVLAGGGARGAYAAGVLAGIAEVLAPHRVPMQFQVFCGSSIGAVSATWLAAHAHERDHAIERLLDEWRGLDLEQTFRPNRLPFTTVDASDEKTERQWSILSPDAVEALARTRIPWARLHENVMTGLVEALLVPALHIATGTTTTFAELSPETTFRPTSDKRRNARLVRMSADHLLASSAFPWIYPARSVDGQWYCDGGIRYNTPISPALRAGAERLLVISLLSQKRIRHQHREEERVHAFPSPLFLLGKIVNALLLDPVEYDLSVLDRFNRVVEVLEETLTPEERERFDHVLIRTRGVPYRKVPTLVFQPSKDLADMAGDFLSKNRKGGLAARALSAMHRYGRQVEADFMSFILLDGAFTGQLIELGRNDAHARAEDIVRFFSGTSNSVKPPTRSE